MACCKPCCGCQDCTDGQQGKCCCGGVNGVCCQAGEYCCNGTCQASPCGSGTCCDSYGGCLFGGPGPGCVPTGSSGDDGCYCDSSCYTLCFDCCGSDASTCCTPRRIAASLWEPLSEEDESIMYDDLVGSLEAVPNVGFEDAMTAAIQCGAFYGDEFKFGPAGRAILAQCLQDMNNGAHQGQRIMAARQECVDVANVIRSA